MLTQNEKEILGAMVDFGALRGQERIEAGLSDENARAKIAEFKEQMAQILPMQIQSANERKARAEEELAQAEALQQLIGNKDDKRTSFINFTTNS